MRLLKFRYLTLAIFIAIILGVWLGRALISERLIASSLQRYGLSAVSTDINRLGLAQSHVLQLGFTMITATGRFQLDIRDAVITYSLEQLAEGRIQDLSIDTLIIEYDSSQPAQHEQNKAADALEPVKILAGLRQALREYILFDSFRVQQVSLRGDAFGALQDRPLQLAGTNQAGSTHAKLTILDPDTSVQTEGSKRLFIAKLSENHIAAELKFSTVSDSPPATLELNINDTFFNGSYTIDPNALKHWLKPFTDTKNIRLLGKTSGTLSVDFRPEHTITTSIIARTDKLAMGSYRADNVYLKLHLETPHQQPFERITVQKNSSIKASSFSYQDFSLDETLLYIAGELVVADDAWQYKGGVRADALTVNYDSRTMLLDDVSAHISADPEIIKINGQLATASLPGRFDFKLAHSLTAKNGELSVTPLESIDLSAGDYRLSQLLSPWPYPFDLLTGNIALTALAAWSDKDDFSLTSTIRLDDTGGQYGELVFSGLSTEHQLEILPDLHSLRSSNIKLEHLDSGVTASNISTRLTLQTATTGSLPRIRIQDLRGEIFDGSFSSSDFIFDPNRRKNSFKISATNVDLAKIVETQQLEDIKLTGRVDGTIPVETNEKGIFIEHGAFINDVSAGTIRYNPATGTEQLRQNPITGIALDALRDFRYSHLSADVNFTPEGMLTISLRLEGTSPELDTSRPVHLNINTEQNLLSLLKSLRYAEGISANIDRKVRRQYEQSPSNKQAE